MRAHDGGLPRELTLTDDFPTPALEDWRRVAEESLRGGSLERLAVRLLEGIDGLAADSARDLIVLVVVDDVARSVDDGGAARSVDRGAAGRTRGARGPGRRGRGSDARCVRGRGDRP